MPWTVANPSSLQTEMAFDLYNKTAGNLFPTPVGTWGINDSVWKALIDLTRKQCTALKIPQNTGNLKGLCIWGSVIAAKFFTLKFGYIDSRVVRVYGDGGDHYFVVIKNTAEPGIADITCNQFVPAPDFITGTLRDIKGVSQGVKIKGLSLYDAYADGAASGAFVL